MGETGKGVKGSPAAQSLSWIMLFSPHQENLRIRGSLGIQGIDPCGPLPVKLQRKDHPICPPRELEREMQYF